MKSDWPIYMLLNTWHFFLKPSTFETCCEKRRYVFVIFNIWANVPSITNVLIEQFFQEMFHYVVCQMKKFCLCFDRDLTTKKQVNDWSLSMWFFKCSLLLYDLLQYSQLYCLWLSCFSWVSCMCFFNEFDRENDL